MHDSDRGESEGTTSRSESWSPKWAAPYMCEHDWPGEDSLSELVEQKGGHTVNMKNARASSSCTVDEGGSV